MITKKYYKLIRVSHEDSEYFGIKNESNDVGNFSIVKTGAPSAISDLEYSLDGVNWQSYDTSSLPSILVNAGCNIYLRGNNPNGFQKFSGGMDYGQSNRYSIYMDKPHSIFGNILSLMYKDTFDQVTSLPSSVGTWTFQRIFQNDTNLISAEKMNFGNITTVGYTPGYATQKIGHFVGMFYGCSSLTTPPDMSLITTLDDFALGYGSAGMFYGCSSLTTPPDLSNITTAGICSLTGTFSGCSSLTTGANLTSITTVGDEVCANMYLNCVMLTSATTPNLQDLTVNIALNNWLSNAGTSVPAGTTKVVNVPTGATITTGSTSGIPTGWTRVDY